MKTVRYTLGVLALALTLAVAGVAAAQPHPDKGPHGGPLVEWGEEEYHPKIVVDKKTGDVTVWVYGTHDDLHKKKLKAIDSKSLTIVLKTTPPTTVKLEPSPEKGDPKGSSTKFTGKNDVFKMDAKWEGTISGKVGTKPYSGDFKQK